MRQDLPEGPVTIMFTDVEGSTALRTSLGDERADEIFRVHDEIVRKAISEHGGYDLQAALGDGFLAVFTSTRRAIACGVAVQTALEQYNRGHAGPAIKIRVGLNTGEVTWQQGQPLGEAVHAASRVCGAASGGEILVSDITKLLAGTVADVAFHDRGAVELKGFPEPWRLWEVTWERAPETAVQRTVFVGRDDELAELRRHLDAAFEGRGGLVMLGGEPGVGKTTLAKRIAQEAEARGMLVLFGRCYESEGAPPYSPFVEMFEQAFRLVDPDEQRADLGEDAAEIARIVPELRRRFPDIGEPLDLPPEQQRRYLFNAMTALLARATDRVPLMLLMDDVHWADEPTLLLIEHVAEALRSLRIIGVGTYRDVELDVSRPLAATMERLTRARTAHRVAVRRFDPAKVTMMLTELAGSEPPPQLVLALYEESEGNPFFVEEVFRHLVEEGRIFDADGNLRPDVVVDELDVPESVRLVVGRRLERLGPQAQKVLAGAAVIGRGFSFSLLEAMGDADAETLLDVVEEAERARVIVPEERDGEAHYTFAHELIRQTLLTSLSLPRRQRLHLKVADAIEKTDPNAAEERPSELAHHLMQAGVAADASRTIGLLARAADRAMEAAAFEDARRMSEAALDLVEADDRRQRAELSERLGWAIRALGRFEECLEIWDGVVDAYWDLGESRRAAELSFEMGYQLTWLGRFTEAFEIYARGGERLGEERSAPRALLLGAQATLAGFAGLYEPSIAAFEEAASIARDVGTKRDLGFVHWGRSVVEWSHARIEDAAHYGRMGLDLLRETTDLWTLVDALAWHSFPLEFLGRWEEAHTFAAEGMELAKKLGHQGGEILAARGINFARLFVDGDLERAQQAFEVDLERMTAVNSPWKCQAHSWLGGIATLRGDLDEGLRKAEGSIPLEPPSAWTGVGLAMVFLNRAYAGDVDACRQLFDERVDAITADGVLPAGTSLQLSTFAEGVALLGWRDEAARLFPPVRRLTDRAPFRIFDTACEDRIAGMVAATLERWEEADGHFAKALSLCETTPNRMDDPFVRYHYGRMLVARGGASERAKELLRPAADDFRTRGMRLLLQGAEELLASL